MDANKDRVVVRGNISVPNHVSDRIPSTKAESVRVPLSKFLYRELSNIKDYVNSKVRDKVFSKDLVWVIHCSIILGITVFRMQRDGFTLVMRSPDGKTERQIRRLDHRSSRAMNELYKGYRVDEYINSDDWMGEFLGTPVRVHDSKSRDSCRDSGQQRPGEEKGKMGKTRVHVRSPTHAT